jgi:hypothetical protein
VIEDIEPGNCYEVLDTSLEEYFDSTNDIDFALRVDRSSSRTRFYIRPMHGDGETLDFTVVGNGLNCATHRLVTGRTLRAGQRSESRTIQYP